MSEWEIQVLRLTTGEYVIAEYRHADGHVRCPMNITAQPDPSNPNNSKINFSDFCQFGDIKNFGEATFHFGSMVIAVYPPADNWRRMYEEGLNQLRAQRTGITLASQMPKVTPIKNGRI